MHLYSKKLKKWFSQKRFGKTSMMVVGVSAAQTAIATNFA